MFPFDIQFPDTAETPWSGFDPDDRFGPEEGLPPSFVDHYHGFQNRYEAFVEYRLGVNVQMQGLKINISQPTRYSEPVVL